MERTFQRKGFAPVRPGDEVEVNIESVGAKGDGIAKIKGFVIIVPGAKQGETIKVKISKVFKKMAFADIIGEGSASESSEEVKEESSDENFEESDEEDEMGEEEDSEEPVDER